MAYGFQQLDASGNVLVDSSAPFKRVTQVWDNVSVTLGYTSPYLQQVNIALPQVSSASDLKNNYIIERISGGTLAILQQREETHRIEYLQYGYVRAYWNTTCYNFFFGGTQTCGSGVFQTQSFNAYVIGKTF